MLVYGHEQGVQFIMDWIEGEGAIPGISNWWVRYRAYSSLCRIQYTTACRLTWVIRQQVLGVPEGFHCFLRHAPLPVHPQGRAGPKCGGEPPRVLHPHVHGRGDDDALQEDGGREPPETRALNLDQAVE